MMDLRKSGRSETWNPLAPTTRSLPEVHHASLYLKNAPPRRRRGDPCSSREAMAFTRRKSSLSCSIAHLLFKGLAN